MFLSLHLLELLLISYCRKVVCYTSVSKYLFTPHAPLCFSDHAPQEFNGSLHWPPFKMLKNNVLTRTLENELIDFYNTLHEPTAVFVDPRLTWKFSLGLNT